MAFSLPTTANFATGAVNELFAARSSRARAAQYRIRAQGDLLEGESYDAARRLATENVQYTATATAIKQEQQQRETALGIGRTEADVAGAGLMQSGSAVDILRGSAREGAIAYHTIGEQGLIQEEAYREQAGTYERLGEAARFAAQSDLIGARAERTAARGHTIAGVMSAIFGIGSLFPTSS